MKKTRWCFFISIFILSLLISNSVFCDQLKADESLKLLKEGNERFIQMNLKHPNETIEQRENTAIKGQSPFAIVLACSDSRVPAEMIFDRGIGDIFVIRVAGNVVMDSSVVGSIEYAAEHLNVPLLVILGHTDCGAIKSAVSDVHVEGKIQDIKNQIKPIVIKTKRQNPGLIGEDLVDSVAENNVITAKTDLLSKSNVINKMSKDGKIAIITAMYNVKTGKVEWLD